MRAILPKNDPSVLDPTRDPVRFRPLEAMRRMQKLIADKEDTEQVFHIITALNGDHIWKELNAFAATEAGRARMRERAYLPPMLDDHETLMQLPEGSVGRAYVAFMEREGLSAQGLVDESEKYFTRRHDDLIQWYGNRKRDTHDLFHVLSGYGRDGLGEASLLAFTHSQSGGGRGVIFISYMGCRQIRKAVPREIDIMACFHEGRRNGKAAQSIVAQDIPALLEEPLDAARERLGIVKPVAYRHALAQIAELGETHELLAAA
jgi:ubiquinone biosynthesis protein COQ4